MFYNDYSYELGKERMDAVARARSNDVLVKRLRAARHEEKRGSMAARMIAVVVAAFR